jgi:hypothetical protein
MQVRHALTARHSGTDGRNPIYGHDHSGTFGRTAPSPELRGARALAG